jgi:LmbE family N-acetylglucosaminyl deacetylase
MAWLAAVALPASAQQPFPPVTHDDRIVIVAPHPDDDLLGAGGLIQQALAVGADVRVIYLTMGDHNQVAFKLYKLDLHLNAREYLVFGERRRKEAIRATGRLGLPADHLTFLGYPDWGTLRMWRDYWDAPQPFRSDATRVSAVPYQAALSPGKPYRPQSVVEDLVGLFRQFQPTRLVVTHPADTNPDHRAAASFVRLAALQLAGEGRQPAIYYYVVHFGRWPRPYHYHPELELEPPRALLDNGDWLTLPLTPEQAERKCAAILEHRTQITTRQYFLVAFARANELFATVPVPPVPSLPANFELDWRRAVRNKAIELPFDEPPVMNGEPVEPTSIALEGTEFLRQGDELIAAARFKNRLGARSGVHLMLYGYRRGAAFGQMPKLRVHLTPLGKVQVYDGRARLKTPGVIVQNVANRSILRIPMRLLGGADVDHLFTATRAHLGEIAADDTAWQLLALPPNPERTP